MLRRFAADGELPRRAFNILVASLQRGKFKPRREAGVFENGSG